MSRSNPDFNFCKMDTTMDKDRLTDLIASNDPDVKLRPLGGKSHYADMYRRIEYHNQLLDDMVYCTECHSILRHRDGLVSNIRRHYYQHNSNPPKGLRQRALGRYDQTRDDDSPRHVAHVPGKTRHHHRHQPRRVYKGMHRGRSR